MAEDKKDGKKTKEPVKKAAEDKKAEAKEPAKKAVDDKKDTKAKEQNKKAEPKVEPKATSSADNDFKAAVTAAANDMETKKSLPNATRVSLSMSMPRSNSCNKHATTSPASTANNATHGKNSKNSMPMPTS